MNPQLMDLHGARIFDAFLQVFSASVHSTYHKKMATLASGHLGGCFTRIPAAMVDLLFKFDREV